MSLRYESGTNQGQTRQITAVGPVLRTVEFPFPPSAGDAFVVVATDARLDAGGNLVPARRRDRGISATVSAGRARDQRLATRIHPQVVQQTSRRWIPFASSLGPDERDAVAARIEGILGVTLPPPILAGRGGWPPTSSWTRRDRDAACATPNRRWILPESVREAITQAVPSTARPVPRVRALLADVPDSIIIRQNISGGAESCSLTRSGGGDQGWVWALIQQPRCCSGGFAGIGVISLNITRLPQRLGLILAGNLADVRRVTPPGDVMWTPSSGWLPPRLHGHHDRRERPARRTRRLRVFLARPHEPQRRQHAELSDPQRG